ncbi:zinc finger transcriptional activator [Saxophila tyrrhenica]|uniref:Zinc finger transcriptional activator n=1 Tax=Saxophila tyrrhenica TaxID=1690608 RepID=A0AAV9P8X6_9PEZI|nr:zinc finger transcriptional activator [Saxophila tyrrhenica]
MACPPPLATSTVSRVAPAGPRGPGTYKRAYKACEACRKTKSKCELQPALSGSACRSNKRARGAKRNIDAATQGDIGAAAPNEVSAPDTACVGEKANAGDGDGRVLLNEDSNVVLDGMPTSDPRQHAPTAQERVTEPPIPGDISNNLAKTMVTSSKDAIGLLFQAADQIDTDSRSDDDDEDDDSPADHLSASHNGTSDAATPLMHMERRLPPQLSNETIALWNKHRFVVQGWFSAFEAISYFEFFFDRFAPLSPVADFISADHETHKRLILDEPLLCCTILMIASRHLAAHGPAGKTRSSFIHARTWRHIEHLVQRITFGTEKYSSAKSRTLGSIHALLLIIEWHPRLLHFPPEHDGWDAGLAPTVDDSFQLQDRNSETARRWREDVFEPAKRSDRLSWTLVGLAITLAHELGVFDPQNDGGEVGAAETYVPSTKIRIKKLLYLYSHQLSLRLGCPNMFPQGEHSVLQPAPAARLSHLDHATRDREVLLTKWIEITKLLTTATHMFFSSPTAIKNILRSYQYIGLLEHFQPLLDRWHEDFSRASLPSIPAAAKQALLVDYYYTRMYINSIALQALVERASQASAGNSWLEQDYLRTESAQDIGFINDVRESSGQILVVTKKLSDDGVLAYFPVRFFLRVVAASIFLLKTISLGSTGTDANVALDHLEDGIQALMGHESDDIHLSSRYAELIARHVRKLKRKLHAKRSGRTSGRKNGAPHMTARASTPNMSQDDMQNLAGAAAQNEVDLGQGSVNMDGMPVGAASWSDTVWDDWLARPLDPLVAPFGIEPAQSTAGLASDSLDFLWGPHM